MRREYTVRVHEGSIPTIEIQGDLTAPVGEDMDAALREACGDNPRSILLKFDGMGRTNSAGIAILINTVMDSRERGCKVYLTGMSQHVRKIFQMVGLTRYADIVESVEDIAV